MTADSPSPDPPRPRQPLTPRALLEIKRPHSPQIHPDGQRVAFTLADVDFEESAYISHLWLTERAGVPGDSEDEFDGEDAQADGSDNAARPADRENDTGGNADENEADSARSQEESEPEDAENANEDRARQLTFSRDGETEPRWSPDGRYLAFLSCRLDETAPLPDDDDDEPQEQIWLLPIDGGEARKLTDAKEGVLEYAWLPDSQNLVYLAPEPRPAPFDSVRRDDRNRRKTDPTVEQDDRLRRQFWRIDLDERKPKWIAAGDYGVGDFDLAPDGERLCYATNYTGDDNDYHRVDLWLLNLADGATAKLTAREGGKYQPRWSPDGAQIAFLSWLDPVLSYSRECLFLADALSAEAITAAAQANVTTGAVAPQADETISPMGATASPAADTNAPVPTSTFAPAPPRLLAPAFDYDLTDFVWTQENDILALAAFKTGSALVRIFPRSGPPNAPADAPNFALLDADVALDRQDLAIDRETGALVYAQERYDAPPELVWREPDDGIELEPLTRLNADFAATYRLPRQEVVSWISADGLPIEGVLTYPMEAEKIEAAKADAADIEKNADPEKKAKNVKKSAGEVSEEGESSENSERSGPIRPFALPFPLIVQAHGGPKGRATHTLRSYSLPAVWASEGYAVLQPNFRGSEGYGQAFAVANRRDLGGGDFQDIMAGVDWCVAQGVADPDRLGIMGGSYGGYLTNWAIGHTDRFRAAISMFGIFHLQSDYGNSGLSRWENEYLGHYYWEDPDIYRRLSPGSYVAAIRTPTLIIHGDDDPNTVLGNSRELYQALRHRGVTTQFVHYPREGHGLREPNHRLDEMRRCLAWMDTHVRQVGQPLARFRIGDAAPGRCGPIGGPMEPMELQVVKVDTPAYLGQPKPATGLETVSLLEVTLILRCLNPQPANAALTFALDDLNLEIETPQGTKTLSAAGVPLDAPGGKILLEGEKLRLVLRPEPETGQIAFGCVAVFRAPRQVSAARTRLPGFPPVEITWTADAEPGGSREE